MVGQGTDCRAVVENVGTKDARLDGGSDGRYLPTGHLVYALGGVAVRRAVRSAALAVTGGPVPIVEGVRRASGTSGTAHFSVSSTGSLVFVPGPAVDVAWRCRTSR